MNDKCINCKWCFETRLSRVCDNGCSEFYQWDIEPYTVACELYKENGGEQYEDNWCDYVDFVHGTMGCILVHRRYRLVL